MAYDKGGYPTDDMIEITLTWPLEPGEILTPVSTPTEYNCRVRYEQAAETEELRKDSSNESA